MKLDDLKNELSLALDRENELSSLYRQKAKSKPSEEHLQIEHYRELDLISKEGHLVYQRILNLRESIKMSENGVDPLQAKLTVDVRINYYPNIGNGAAYVYAPYVPLKKITTVETPSDQNSR